MFRIDHNFQDKVPYDAMKIVLGVWLYLSLEEMDPASSNSLERSGSVSCLAVWWGHPGGGGGGGASGTEGGAYARYQNLKINSLKH